MKNRRTSFNLRLTNSFLDKDHFYTLKLIEGEQPSKAKPKSMERPQSSSLYLVGENTRDTPMQPASTNKKTPNLRSDLTMKKQMINPLLCSAQNTNAQHVINLHASPPYDVCYRCLSSHKQPTENLHPWSG